MEGGTDVLNTLVDLFEMSSTIPKEIEYVMTPVAQEKSAQAAGIVSMFRKDRHDTIGRYMANYLPLAIDVESSVYTIIDTVGQYFNLSKDDIDTLRDTCDLKKTPDAICLQPGRRKLLSIIDFKGLKDVDNARRETKEKYEKAIASPMRQLGLFDVEVIIAGVRPTTGEMYMDFSQNTDLWQAFQRMINDEETMAFCSKIVQITQFIERIVDAYSQFPAFVSILRAKGRVQVSTPSYFQTEIDKLLNYICSGSNGFDYTMDDMFRLSPPKVNYIRLMCLLVEYYDFPTEDEDLIKDIKLTLLWLESPVVDKIGIYIKKAYRDLKDSTEDFRIYCDTILQEETYIDRRQLYDIIDYTKANIRYMLDEIYLSEVRREAENICKIKQEEIDSFKPGEPKLTDLEEGMKDCMTDIENDNKKVFVHAGKSQQPFSFLFPTDSGSEEILEDHKKNEALLNNCKASYIYKDMFKDVNKNGYRFVPIGEHWQLNIENMANDLMLYKGVSILSRCKNGYDEKKSVQEFFSFKAMIQQSFGTHLTTSDWQYINEIGQMSNDERKHFEAGIQKMPESERKIFEFSTIPNMDGFFMYKGVITDSNNFCIGSLKSKLMKKLNILQDNRQCYAYLYRAGVSTKQLRREQKMGLDSITIKDLKELEENGLLNIESLQKKDIEIIDTRTRVIDYRCKECTNCSEVWCSTLHNYSRTILDEPIKTKLYKTVNDISQSSAHDEMQGVRENLQKRMDSCYKSMMMYSIESISQLFEGLLVKSNFNKINTISSIFSNSTDTVLIKLPGEKLYNPRKTVPFLFIQKIKLSDLKKNYMRQAFMLNLHNVNYTINNGEYIYLISRPQRLDLNRINTLSKSEMRVLLAASVLFDTVVDRGVQKIEDNVSEKILGNAIRLAVTTSISQMSLRDPLKYLFTLAIADASDIRGFLTEKFKYHIKSVSDLKLFTDVIGLIWQLIDKRKEIKEANQVLQKMKITEEGFIEGGWKSFDIRSPFTGMKYRDIKQLVNEVLVNVYFVQKELHNPVTNLEKLVNIPCEFEIELKKHIAENLKEDKVSQDHMNAHGCQNDCPELLKVNLNRFLFNRNTMSGDGKFSYKPLLVLLSCRKRMKSESHKAELIRPKIESLERVKSPIVMIDTLTSSKSSTKVVDSNLRYSKRWTGTLKKQDMDFNDFNMNKRRLHKAKRLLNRVNDEIKNVPKIHDICVLKARVTVWNSIQSQIENYVNNKRCPNPEDYKPVIERISVAIKSFKKRYAIVKSEKNPSFIYNEEKFREKVCKDGRKGFLRNEVPLSDYNLYIKNTMDEYIISETTPVKEALYDLLKNCRKNYKDVITDIDKVSVVDICKLDLELNTVKDTSFGQFNPVIRMFPKGQRTFTDREIYIMDILSKIKLYFIEHSYKHIDKINDYEAISLPGEAKSYFISKQEVEFLLKNATLMIEESQDRIIRLMNHLNADESKWSARDVALKFIEAHMAAICAKPSERLMMIYIQLQYMKKFINIPENIMQRATIQKARSIEAEDMLMKLLDICTDEYTKNYILVTFNWLQGNFNYLSSFIHTAVMEFLSDVLKMVIDIENIKLYKKAFSNDCNFTSMVHSDDAAISTAILITLLLFEEFFKRKWKSYARYIFYVTKRIKSYFSITLNPMKTFCSESIKDFISEFLVNGEFIGNYARYIVNCCGDSNFKSPKEDISMLMSAPQTMARRGSTMETLLVSIAVVNYHVYHTYSMCHGEINDPMSSIILINELLQNGKFNESKVKLMKNSKARTIVEKTLTTQVLKVSKLSQNRNEMVLTIGGYCNPPLQLLAVLGAKAHDAYILMQSFKGLLTADLFLDAIKNPESLSQVSIKVLIERLKKSPNLYPSALILISTFLLRQELGFVNARFSKFDIQRISHANLFSFPSAKYDEKYPVKYSSYQDFLSLTNNKTELGKLLKDTLSESQSITGTCQSLTQYESRMKLDYQLTKRIDVFQTLPTATQRLSRLSNSSHKVFLPVNLLDGLDKIKLSESIKDYATDKLGLVDSKISVLKGEKKAVELYIKKYNKLELDDYVVYQHIRSKLKTLNEKLESLETERSRLRMQHDDALLIDKKWVSELLYLIAEISTNKTLQESMNIKARQLPNMVYNLDHYNNVKGDDNYIYIQSEMERLVKLNKAANRSYSPLRTKLRLGDAILFLILYGIIQNMDDLIESYIYSMLAVVFNDKIMNFFLKVDIATKKTGIEDKTTATLQMVVYPYQVKQLTYRAEDVIKCILMNNIEMADFKKDMRIDDATFNNDMEMVGKIIIDLELEPTINELKKSIEKFKFGKSDFSEDDIFEMMSVIKRYGVLYNILVKTISLYNTRQAYTLSRARIVDAAHIFFEGFKGNYIKSEQYVGMKLNPTILQQYNLDILTEHDESIRSIRRALDSITSLVDRCQRLFTTQIGPVDIIEILKFSKCGRQYMWDYLESVKDIIKKSLYEFKGYLPLLYHLGIIGEVDTLEKLQDTQVQSVWHKAHTSRKPLEGYFHVEYKYKRLKVEIMGRATIFHRMVITKDHRYYEWSQSGFVFNNSFSKIMERVERDFELVRTELPDIRRENVIFANKSKKSLRQDFYYIVEPGSTNRAWFARERDIYSQVAYVLNEVIIIVDTVTPNSMQLVDFYSMHERLRSMLNLCVWRLDKMDESFFLSTTFTDKTEQYSMLYNSNVDYLFNVDHNLNQFMSKNLDTDIEQVQEIVEKNRRAKPERFTEIDILVKKKIIVNGLNLKVLLDIMRDIEDTKFSISIMSIEKLEQLVPPLEPVFAALESLAVESQDADQSFQDDVITVLKSYIDESLQGGIESVITNYNNEQKTVNREVYRALIKSTDYLTLTVNILERFPSSQITFSKLISIIIKSIYHMNSIINVIGVAGRKEKDYVESDQITLEIALTDLLSKMYHLNNIVLLYKATKYKNVLDNKIKVSMCIRKIVISLMSVSYLFALQSTLSNEESKRRVSEIPRLMKLRLYNIIDDANNKYKNEIPSEEIITPGTRWQSETRLTTFPIITEKNFPFIKLKNGEKYIDKLKSLLVQLRNKYEGTFLSSEDIVSINGLVMNLNI